MTGNEKKKAFVIMPFDDVFGWAYTTLIRPSFESAGFDVTRVDDLIGQRRILKDIVLAIREADVVIADLTDSNANVFYELGVAHALDKRVVLISQDITSVPFDLRSYRIIEYGHEDARVFRATKDALTRVAVDTTRNTEV